MKYNVDVLLKVFSENTGIWPSEDLPLGIPLVWVKVDENTIEQVFSHTSDGVAQFEEIQDKLKPCWWFLRLIFNAGEIEAW